ncbi:MAG: TetR family transcriptional regulator [Pseudonocardiaceae bacterium]|nr:TetR family transcriptional regulator [Pseudonocardiaceae bacterium]
MVVRRSDTKERIEQVALELFVEQGYEKTSLREIAERLEVTKAALYYHYRTKEDIVHGLIDDLVGSLDELLEWGRAQPRPAQAREEVLRRFATLVEGRFGPIMQFIQQNMPAMKELGVKHSLGEKLAALFQLVGADEHDPAMQLRTRLALVAILLSNAPMFGAPQVADVSTDLALQVALELVAPRESF